MTDADLEQFLRTAIEAAHRAAAVMADWRDRFSVREKGRADLVTEADEAAQQVLREFLLSRFPQHAFLGEEGLAAKSLVPGGPPTWIVDPIDGTTNYVHDIPFYCTSIGLWAEGELVVGAIYDPRHAELFTASVGHGAWLGDRRLKVSTTADLENALLAGGFPADMRGKPELLEWWSNFAVRSRGLRRTGSTALNLAYVAAGRFDGSWATENKIWDVAAGIVILREAGGCITRLRDDDYDPAQGEFLATNGHIHEAMRTAFL